MSLWLLLFALIGPEARAEPIAPAEKGMLQCYSPDDIKKTCRSLAGYKPEGDGSYSNDATVLLAADGPITLRTSSIVRIKNGAICGTLSIDQIKRGTILVAGQAIAPAQATALLDKVAIAMAPAIGKEICTSYTPIDDDLLIARAAVDGVPRPELDQKVRWIRPEDGFRVAS